MSRLPIIVSVPHGGEIIAPELADQTLLTKEDIFSDGDPLTRQLYGFRDEVAYYYESPIARAAVDLNRPPDSVPPENCDGVVKSYTVQGKPVYRKNRVPRNDTLRLLLNKYYEPFHRKLWQRSRRSDLFCGLDCHTMLDHAPVISDQPGEKRPFICLSNQGDTQGRKVHGRRLTCPPEMVRSLAQCLKEVFPEEEKIVLNDPFLGGYIVRKHSRHLPWIQIELNRRAYLGKSWFDRQNLAVCNRRIEFLRLRFLEAIREFVDRNYLGHYDGEDVA